ncbi:MAG: TolC family protein [Bryobacteraceae bacterium]
MLKLLALSCLPCIFAGTAAAEVHALTLRQALDIASRQNPDVLLARLDQQHAEAGIRIANDPFRPKVYAGSGLAYTYGYPNSIDGSAPSVFQMRTDMQLYNRPDRYQAAAASQSARAADYGAQAKEDDVAYRTADLFLTASQIEREEQAIKDQLPSLRKVVEITHAGVEEGSRLPVDLKQAQVNLEVASQQLGADRLDNDYYEMMLAMALGYPATDRVKPLDSDVTDVTAPASAKVAIADALKNNKKVRQLQSSILTKELVLRSYKAERWPQVSLVAQYSLFAPFANYTQYFKNFQYNNAQIGAAITIPVLLGSARGGHEEQTSIEMAKLRVQLDQLRNQIIANTKRSYQQWEKAKTLRDLTREQLELARQELTVKLAQNGEGKLPMSDVEQARVDEENRWVGLYAADAQVTRAKFAILRQMGALYSSVRAADHAAPAARQRSTQSE